MLSLPIRKSPPGSPTIDAHPFTGFNILRVLLSSLVRDRALQTHFCPEISPRSRNKRPPRCGGLLRLQALPLNTEGEWVALMPPPYSEIPT
jgi:hypothetical protein